MKIERQQQVRWVIVDLEDGAVTEAMRALWSGR
jgi:hypothetical protein